MTEALGTFFHRDLEQSFRLALHGPDACGDQHHEERPGRRQGRLDPRGGPSHEGAGGRNRENVTTLHQDSDLVVTLCDDKAFLGLQPIADSELLDKSSGEDILLFLESRK